MLGEFSEAERYCLEAIRTYVQYDNQQEIARLHELLALIYSESSEIDQSLQYLDDGLTIVRKLHDSDSLEIRLELLHISLAFLGRLHRAKEYCQVYEEIQEVIKLIGTPQAAVQGKVVEMDYWTSRVYKENYRPTKVQALIEDLEKMEAEDTPLVRAYYVCSKNFNFCGKYELTRTYSLKGLEVAKREHFPNMRFVLIVYRFLQDLLSGYWKLALPKVELSMSKARRIDVGRSLVYAYATKGTVHAWMGKYAEAQLCLDEIKRFIPAYLTKDWHVIHMITPVEMMIALGEGRAEAYYISMNRTTPYYVVFPWLNLSLWGEIQLSVGDRIGALDTAEELLAVNKEENLYSWALGKRLYSKVDFALENRESAWIHIQEAADYFTELKMPLEHARTLLIYADMILEDNPDEAKNQLLQCMEIFEHLDAENDLSATQALMKKLGVRMPKPNTMNNKETELSKREIEISRHVAEGLTNIEIAEALFISPRTVSTHLEKNLQASRHQLKGFSGQILDG